VGYKTHKGRLEFSVESHGPKIEDHEVERIFEPFYRGDEARRRGAEGTGFGLAAAQNIARAIGTSITVDQTEHAQNERMGFRTVFKVLLETVSDGKGS
jgi:two-component system, OmpR family, sensor kinase